MAKAQERELEARFQKCLVDHPEKAPYIEALADLVGRKTKAVMARTRQDAESLLESSNRLLPSYRKRLGTTHIPEGGEFDVFRPASEASLFTGYEDRIHYAMLSFEDVGPHHYGDVSLVFKEEAISHRATVFQENSGMFPVKNEISVSDLTHLPKGKHATWEDRGKLCAAKLAAEVEAKMTLDQYQDLIVRLGTHGKDDEFLEVNIYGSINRQAIKKVIFHPGREKVMQKIHKLLAQDWRNKLKTANIDVEAL